MLPYQPLNELASAPGGRQEVEHIGRQADRQRFQLSDRDAH